MIELSDIQSIVVRPDPSPAMRLVFFSFGSPAEQRAFLAVAEEKVTTGRPDGAGGPRGAAINVGVSAAGLRLAAIPTRAYDALSPAFTAGMRAAASRLVDVGESDPSTWDAPFREPASDIHAVVIGLGAADLSAFGVDAALAPTWSGARLADGKEPFGFRDGISDPVIEGSGTTLTPGNGVWDRDRQRWRPVRAGEAVLGYADESGSIAGHPDAAQIERNGSYLVIRKLEQDVAAFAGACQEWSAALAGSLSPDEVAARLVGRHQDGVALGASREEPLNDFRYRDGCAVGRHVMPSAHIRRTNPHDGIATSDSIVPRHQLFRRGMPYRESASDGTTREGLLFLACCADIRRQFEFVQSHWVQDGLRFGLGHERDPLLGHRDDPAPGDPEHLQVSIADRDGKRVRHTLSSFVTTRGGEYFLLPSRTALGQLARVPGTEEGGWT